MIQHCNMCGTSHDLHFQCPDEAMAFFKCLCGQYQVMPRDACFGLDGMVCGCGRPASTWSNVTGDQYRAATHPYPIISYDTHLHEKFVVRLPYGLRDKLRKLAEKNRRSMNSEVLLMIEKALEVRGE